LKAARLRGAKTVISVDREEYRLAKAKELTGAEIFNFEKVDAVEAIRSLTGGRGADVVVDAVGMEAHRSTLKKVTGALTGEAGSTAALELCLSAVRRGGIVSILGVYGSNYGFPVGQMFDKGIEIKCGQAPAHALIDRLLKHVEAGELVLDDVISHRMPLAEAPKAYQIFCDKKDNCVKVVLTP
jgi:S-(hydroxymethyl)glutathione dehydrogenase/alcohol dehydrogenase